MKYQLLLLTLFLSFGCKKEKVEYNCNIEKVADAYEYPLKPGTVEWEQLNSSQEMIDTCQIPDFVLNEISTEGLIETVLNYPMFGDIYASNVNIQTGFNAFYENFNGIQELLIRKDAAMKLLERYKQMHPACKENNWPSLVEPGGNNNFSFSFIEIIIAQYYILDQIIKDDEIKAVLQETISKYRLKNEFNYSVIGKQHSVLISGRIMYLCNYTPFIDEYNNNYYVRIFIDGASNFKSGTLDIVNTYAKNFLIKKNEK